MFDADSVGSHHLVRPEEELNPVIIEMGMEAVADEARGYRVIRSTLMVLLRVTSALTRVKSVVRFGGSDLSTRRSSSTSLARGRFCLATS